jgi:uncharacterized membrane protein HdeD (DUF308 family)
MKVPSIHSGIERFLSAWWWPAVSNLAEVPMLHTLTANWWALALRGLVAVLFGLLTFFLPGITLVTLVLLFGAYALADGVFNVIAFFRVASHQWALLIEGVVGIIAGVLTFAWPAITAIVLLYLIAFWAILTGVFEILAGIRLRKTIANEWLLLLMGVLSLLFGLLILFAPGTGALAIVLWIGAYALVFGIFLLALAFRLRGHRRLIAQPT